MNVGQLKNSQFLKKEDVGNGVLVTISNCTEENVALPGASPEMKWALHFSELEKPLILNQTNGTLIQAITGSPESDDWIGKKVVLYSDPNIMFQGKLVGGIRVRAPKGQAAKAAAAQPKPAPAKQPEPVKGRDYDAQPNAPTDEELGETPF